MIAIQIARLEIVTETAAAPASVTVRCAGAWTVQGVAPVEQRLTALSLPPASELVFDISAVSALDTAGAWLLHRTIRAVEQRGTTTRISGLKPEFDTLLQLIAARAEVVQPVEPVKAGLLASIGLQAWRSLFGFSGMLAFIGESAVTFLRSLIQPRRIRWRPVLHNLQTAGFEALPITGLLSFLMGVVIAYQGADQLQRFGANIFIADLVGLSMLRELSPLLTAIIVAGRSGSAYAAQIGTMKINEEIDALRTIGIGPQELLVQPKIVALVIALPLLTVYADVAGVLGGMLMANSMLDISYRVFLDRLEDALSLSSFLTGIIKAPVFAVIIALVGCYQGFQASGSADSVGRQTTVSVVQSIFLVIVADALFSVIFNWLDL
ncbi:MAG TPA: MlaE family lipid ABC transporter permease subunit [Acidiferrobacterales bacterium]|nr:MlaE family lipid ABC transporter permease subunit [Acidiferrobacterales bacterium]